MKDFATAIKAMKALRPLRLAKTPALRDTGASLLASIPSLFNSALINVFFIYIFGIIGVQTLCGKVSSCSDDTFLDKKACLDADHQWVIPA
jgi:hypothetical protein